MRGLEWYNFEFLCLIEPKNCLGANPYFGINIKGEFVVVVSGFDDSKISNDDMDIISRVNYYIKNGLSSMDAIKLVAKERNIKKSDVYSEYHRGDK